MPAIRNPHSHDIFNYTLNKTIRKLQTVEVTQEQFDELSANDTGVWEYISEPPAKRTPRNSRRTGGKVSELSGKKGERR